jgi:hypothetical protein
MENDQFDGLIFLCYYNEKSWGSVTSLSPCSWLVGWIDGGGWRTRKSKEEEKDTSG